MIVRQCTDQVEWDQTVQEQGGHPLQLWGWGELKAKHNWRAHRFVVEDAGRVIGGMQILQRTMPWPFRSVLYVPRGPFGNTAATLDTMTAEIRNRFTATHITIEPDRIESVKNPGWKPVGKGILLARTVALDLTKPEEQLLAEAAKKTRQYIRKSASAGVEVSQATSDTDMAACLTIYKQTAARAGFSLHSDAYYHDLHQAMGEASKIYVARYEGRAVAFLWLVMTEEVAFELYGGVNDEGQAVRANYTLKWQVIQAMKSAGVRRYDMNGLLNDGVSTFKRSFASDEVQLAGTYDYRLSVWYLPWKFLFPTIKKVLQFIASLRK